MRGVNPLATGPVLALGLWAAFPEPQWCDFGRREVGAGCVAPCATTSCAAPCDAADEPCSAADEACGGAATSECDPRPGCPLPACPFCPVGEGRAWCLGEPLAGRGLQRTDALGDASGPLGPMPRPPTVGPLLRYARAPREETELPARTPPRLLPSPRAPPRALAVHAI